LPSTFVPKDEVVQAEVVEDDNALHYEPEEGE
jgi:hypothetical protein